jgi:hypothetical protein
VLQVFIVDAYATLFPPWVAVASSLCPFSDQLS